jgi:hypothetical protein
MMDLTDPSYSESGNRLLTVLGARLENRESLTLRHTTGEELTISGIEGRNNYYGFVMSGEFSPTALMYFPRSEWRGVQAREFGGMPGQRK